MRFLAVLLAACAFSGCGESATPGAITRRFEDRFERSSVGADYRNTGGPYAIVNGELHVKGARNHPLWLRRRLPRDAAIEFDVRSETPDGDIKVELYGDGQSYALEDSYTATSYVVVFGGWRNSLNVLARMDEHGDDRRSRREPKVRPGRRYHFRIVRSGAKVSWSVDGESILELDDREPLAGPGHEYFAFNNWQSDLFFDNLVVSPADGR